MDSDFSSRQLRRSTRQSISANASAVNYGPTPRGPIKRAKKSPKPQSDVSAVNGANNNDTDDEDSPEKKRKVFEGDTLSGGDGHGPPKDVLEPMETQENSQEPEGSMDQIKTSKQLHNDPIFVPGSRGDVHLTPYVLLGQRCTPIHPDRESVSKTQAKQPKKRDECSIKHTPIAPPIKGNYGTHKLVTVPSMADYKKSMEARITEPSKVNNIVPSSHPLSVKTTTTRRRATDSKHTTGVTTKKQETKKNTASGQNPGAMSKGFLKYLWQFALLILLSAGLLMAFQHLSTLQRATDGSTHSSTSVNSGLFVEELSRIKARFPSQHPELWKRSQIHLQKHLSLSHPTEPVSMILTAGLRAQKTLRCLAQNIASAFSSTLNASIVIIDGNGQTNLDSDQVKMDVDSQLKAAFEGDKLAAVVHRFEELPPGSTLIFYRYCDHETAAYKRAFMLFTVLLSEENLSPQKSLKEVEEMVRDYVEKRFVGNEKAFNKMDTDKFSGLWSRIAHLILPVGYEEDIEQKGC